jgi:hypothetical protein
MRLVSRFTRVSLRARDNRKRDRRRVKLRHQFWNIGGIVLQIAVNQNEDCTSSGLQARRKCGALSGVFFETDHSQIRRGFNSLHVRSADPSSTKMNS